MSLKSLGSQLDLYTIYRGSVQDSLNSEIPIFTKVLDTPAAKIRDKIIEEGIISLSLYEKKQFVIFLLMLLLRRADSLAPSMLEAERQWRSMVMGAKRTIDGKEYPLSEVEAATIYNNELQGMGAFSALRGAMEASLRDERIIQFLLLEWRVMDFTGVKLDLVLADNPVQFWGDEGCVERVFLPLSPKKLLVMASKDFFANFALMQPNFREMLALELVVGHFQSAKRFVAAKDLGINQVFVDIAKQQMPKLGATQRGGHGFSSLGWRNL